MRAHVVGWTERATGDASIEPGGFAGADETRRVSVVVVGETVEIGRASIGGCIVVVTRTRTTGGQEDERKQH